MPKTKPLSRRSFIAATSASALAAAAPAAADAAHRTKRKPAKKKPAPKTKRVDVAIVGAGLTGLTAARELRHRGFSIHVVEADSRMGGRIWTGKAKDGTPLNYGATFIGPGQDRIAALGRELGVATYPTFVDGENVLLFDGRRETYTGTIPPLDPVVLAESLVLDRQAELDGAGARSGGALDGAARARVGRADVRDMEARQRPAPPARASCSSSLSRRCSACRVVTSRCCSSSSTSARRATSTCSIDTAGGAQERQFTGGTQQIAEKLAASLGRGAVTLAVARAVHPHEGRQRRPSRATGSRWPPGACSSRSRRRSPCASPTSPGSPR